MYCEWASLQGEIQCDKANQSVLNKFPPSVGKDVACTVVKSIAQNLSITSNNPEPSNLISDKEVKWTMEVLCFGLSLPLAEHETIKECVNVYCEWLTCCTEPKICVPKPITENPNPYTQDMIHHLLNLFVPRPGSGLDLVKRQAMHCHRVLRAIEDLATKSTILTRNTWETLLKFLLAANDSLLSPPTERDDTGLSSYDIGDHLCERVLSVLFEIWLLACHKCFPSPSLWKTFRNMCVNWRHHETLVVQWNKVNHVLTGRLLKFLYGPDYPVLQFGSSTSQDDGGGQMIPEEMSYETISQCWFRYLHIIKNPVDLCHPEIIGNTPKFCQQVMPGNGVANTLHHECLNKLPYIFFRAMRGISIMVNAFLGMAQSIKAEEDLIASQTNRQVSAPSTPPGQRKPNRPISSVIAGTLQTKGSKTSIATSATAKSSTLPPNLSGHVSFDARQPLAPSRPRCNSILHLFGAWLFDAALARVNLHASHKKTVEAKADSRSSSFTDTRQTSVSIDFSSINISLNGDNTYEAGRAEAIGTLCRIFCAHKTGEEILPTYYSRFYISMYYGLQTGNDTISGQVLSSIIFNSCDLLRVNLDGIQLLVPYILTAIQLILSETSLPFKLNDDRTVELRRSSIHLLLSMLCLPLHFKDLQIKDFVPAENSNQTTTFISLRKKITELLLRALLIEVDPTNTQMLLGGLMLAVQDLAMCEEAEQILLQPQQHDTSIDSAEQAGSVASMLKYKFSLYTERGKEKEQTFNNTSDTSHLSLGTTSSDSSYQDTVYHRVPHTSLDIETAFGLFGRATSEVCTRLLVNWKSELNTALAAMELLCGLAKVKIKPPNLLMCKRTVRWICDFIVSQCSRPSQHHTRDLHSMIVAAFKCLTLWLVEHCRLLYDKDCLHYVLEVVELGISGSKSQNRASDIPKFKGDKELLPASMRVKESAEGVLTVIIQHVGAFPPPCGPESLFSLLDEKSLLKYCKGNSIPEVGSPFKYFVLDNSIIVGLLEQPLGNVEDPLPTVTALIRGPFGRHAWTMQLRHAPRANKNNSRTQVSDPGRPLPMENVGTHHNIKPRYFPDTVDKIPLTKADKSIPTLESLVKDTDRSDLNKLKSFIDKAVQFENDICRRSKLNMKQSAFPHPDIECKSPSITQEYQTARLFLSHYGFLSLDALQNKSNSIIPPALVMLDTTNSGLFTDIEMLDTVTPRDNDTVHIFYVKSGQKDFSDILYNVTNRNSVQSQFIEFLHALGWPVDVRKHAGWTGHVSTSWKIMEIDDDDDIDEPDYDMSTGGSVYDGRQQVLYWADVSSEVAFIVPSTYSKVSSSNSSGDKSPLIVHKTADRSASDVTLNNKPKTLSLDRADHSERLKGDSPNSPHDPPIQLRKPGRQPALMVGPDIKILVVWLENFQDHENFPTEDALDVTSTGIEQLTSLNSNAKTQDKDTFIIFIHALQNGLYRIHMQGITGRINMAIPLIDGMVVSRRTLGPMVRQTAINIGRRKRLESETYQPPHVRRKLKIQEMVNKYHLKMSEPEFYTALFHDVPK